jgi:flagellin
VSFSINTNIASLDAQNYLQQSAQFQDQTINEVTSGLRIVNSGDDAAGLAVANGLANDQAVLTQGIQNANDGLGTLQTIDGGMNNISQLLDRASTLATESASSTFTGNRSTLNAEFQSVLTEVNRQAQAIGLNTGGQFAQDLSVYIGGGTASGTTTAIQNGSINVNLTNAAVDTQSLGLSGYSVTGNSATDIGDGAGATSVANIISNTTNQASETQAGNTTFYVTGSGFANTTGSDRIALSVNLNGVTNATTLAAAINTAIQSAGNGSTQQATAFKNAGISASVYTNATTGTSSLQFTSSSTAFQVEAGDSTANALLGNVVGTTAVGQSVAASTVAGASQAAMASTSANTGAETVNLAVSVGGTNTNVQFSIGAAEAQATTVADLNTALAAANSGAGAGVTASLNGSNQLVFTATNANQAQSVQVEASGDASNVLGLGSFAGTGSTASYTSITGTTAPAAGTQHLQIAIGNQVASLTVTSSATLATTINNLNTALQGNDLTRAAGITAVSNGTKVELESNNSTSFRVNEADATDYLGFGAGVDSSAVAAVTGTAQNGSDSPSLDANGTATSGFLNFQGFTINGNSQTVSLTAPDASGSEHAISFSLSSANAGSIDAALSTINTQLQDSNDSTLQQIVAVKDQSNGVDGIRFVSSLPNFDVSLGTTATGTASAGVIQGISNGTGTTSQGGAVIASTELGTGSTADISTFTNAENAVTALGNAVTALGNAQAAVGKGENLFTYATNLAQSQVTNEAAEESGIKDANLAEEASNLSKAQILVQAGTAALSQANSAPQAILSLLQH